MCRNSGNPGAVRLQPLYLTLASPSVNRHQKSDNDPAEWLPDLNRCWYVDRTIQVRLAYGITID